MIACFRLLLALALLAIVSTAPLPAGNWPQWRGPEGNSVSRERDLPLVWREDFNAVWKAELPGPGNSTPAIWGDAVFVTSQQDDKLLLQRFSKKTGKVVWTKQVGTGTLPQASRPKRGQQVFHRLQNMASPSPVTDGTTVVAHFGNGDLAAYDFDGNQLWRRNLQEDHGNYTIWWGHANSPVIYKDLIISVCMQDSLADLRDEPTASYLVAHDLKKGRVQWRVERKTEAKSEECDAYTTPVFQTVDGRVEMIVMGANQLDSYDPLTGKQHWYLPGLRGGRTVPGPTVAGPYVVMTRGFRGPIHAMKLSRNHQGKLNINRAVSWTRTSGTPDSCSPAVWADLVFTVSDDGIAQCYNGLSGRVHWKRRIKGKYKASPITGQNRVYFLNEDGLCTVVSATPQYEKLIENQLDDRTLASPATSDGQVFIRGHKRLYCLGRK